MKMNLKSENIWEELCFILLIIYFILPAIPYITMMQVGVKQQDVPTENVMPMIEKAADSVSAAMIIPMASLYESGKKLGENKILGFIFYYGSSAFIWSSMVAVVLVILKVLYNGYLYVVNKIKGNKNKR